MAKQASLSPRKNLVDDQFYLSADAFFKSQGTIGLTYDDVSLATQFSNILPRDTDLATTLSDRLSLNIPILSSDMDTVTEGRMAIAMAQNGGLGIIHYNLSLEQQCKEVAKVKHHIHGVIQNPITVAPSQSIGDVLDLIDRKRYGFRTFPVVDERGILLGLLSSSIVKDRYRARLVSDAMTPLAQVRTVNERKLSRDPIKEADKFFTENIGIHKLLVVDDDNRLKGLVTASDIEQIFQESKRRQKPTRDSDFRLCVAAAVPTIRTPDGSLDRDRILFHVSSLVGESVDAVAVSTAHGFTEGVGEMVQLIRREFKDITIIAGNVTSGAGVEFLADAGADAIKIGQGPGSICTTRIVAGVGIPQLTALYVASRAAKRRGVRIIADGGLTKSGDLVKALTLADSVICGSLLAGCPEAPGEILEINGKRYKQYRGMGSHAAMRAGSATRYGHLKADNTRKVAAEGIEALKEVSHSVNDVLAELIGGVQSGMGYLGARNLKELRTKARYIRVSPAGQKEAAPHDVIEIKATTNG
jgi:IMP dehydrogenase